MSSSTQPKSDRKINKVALIQGGMGAEAEVSRSTARGFAEALQVLGYDFVAIEADARLPVTLVEAGVDVALLAVHGKYAEDGTVQGVCEYLKIPYTGTGILGSALCMDKILTKDILRACQLPTANFQVLNLQKTLIHDFVLDLPLPVVVKPSREGSSVGISIVQNMAELVPALQLAARYDRHLLVEKFVDGVEATVPVLLGRALTPIEIAPKSGFYTYENKYTAGKSDYYVPARLPEATLELCRRLAEQACEVCRVRTYARVDFRVSPAGECYIMEINTLPGFTPTSLFPKAAHHDGIDFTRLTQILIENASLDYEGVS